MLGWQWLFWLEQVEPSHGFEVFHKMSIFFLFIHKLHRDNLLSHIVFHQARLLMRLS